MTKWSNTSVTFMVDHDTGLLNIEFILLAMPPESTSVPGPPWTVVDTSMPITLQQFRGLMGIPYDESYRLSNPATVVECTSPYVPTGPSRSPTYATALSQQTRFAPLALHPAQRFSRPHLLPQWFHTWLQGRNAEAPSSIYFTILNETKKTERQYKVYDVLIYGSLIAQLILSAVLIMLGALPKSFNLTISIIGASQDLLAGVLSILKGQGLPMRLVKYMDALRRVREEIEFCERELRMGINVVTVQKALDIRDMYSKARDDQLKNNPGMWQASRSKEPGGAFEGQMGGAGEKVEVKDMGNSKVAVVV